MRKEVQQRFWCIRAGKNASANNLFMEQGVVALADAGLEDLSKLKATRDDFHTRYRELHPEETRIGSAAIAGKFFKFINEIAIDDAVLYPCLIDKCIYVGVVRGEYGFIKNAEFPHRRSVVWKWIIPKSELKIQTQYELGAARTLFEFKKNVRELLVRISAGQTEEFSKSKAPTKRRRV